MLSQLTLMYLLFFKPYKDPMTNLNEIFNECCVLLTAYQLFVFTDFVDSIDMKIFFGYCMIGTILMNFGVNILIQLITGLKLLSKVFKRFRQHSIKYLSKKISKEGDNIEQLPSQEFA